MSKKNLITFPITSQILHASTVIAQSSPQFKQVGNPIAIGKFKSSFAMQCADTSYESAHDHIENAIVFSGTDSRSEFESSKPIAPT